MIDVCSVKLFVSGYMSPEYALHGVFSEKSDVYSFGVILLELVSGKRATGVYPLEHSDHLLGYVRYFFPFCPLMCVSSSFQRHSQKHDTSKI